MAFENLNRKYKFDKNFGFDLNDFINSIINDKIKHMVDMREAMITPGSFRMP